MNKFVREGMRGGVTSLFDSRITFTGSVDEENFILGKLQDFTRESEGDRASTESKIRYGVVCHGGVLHVPLLCRHHL